MLVKADSPGAFTALVEHLSRGGLAIAPGDTMYGIVGIAPDSEEAMRMLKGRGEDKPFLQLLGSAAWLPRLSDMPLPTPLAKYWPGPLTVVLRDKLGGTVAVRVPDSPFLSRLLSAVGRPLFSTSVNKAGSPPLASLDEMNRVFGDEVGMIYDAGDISPGAPSTLLDVTTRPFRVLRQGALRLDPADLH
jgi:L-threonylcarbamoyladenylate synthase